MVNFDEKFYLDQYSDIKLFYKDYVGETMLSPIITYGKMKEYYPFQINDLRFQIVHMSPKKIKLFEENDDNQVNTFIYIILRKHEEIK